MILDISDQEFKNIFDNKSLWLPIQWDNNDFSSTLQKLFKKYIDTVKKSCKGCYIEENRNCGCENILSIERVCELLVTTIQQYLNGFPAQAFETFGQVMCCLQQVPLKTYEKSIFEQLQGPRYRDSLNLYRVACVNENTLYDRSRVFHTPYSLRSKVSTNRYSIAGFPSLYLGTSLELCYEEVHPNPSEEFIIASRFQLERDFEFNNTEIKVIELAIKPQDFLERINRDDNTIKNRVVSRRVLESSRVRRAYLFWYPLIAACSFIRVNKKDPFAAEYIIPQLLMQWVRTEIGSPKRRYKRLIGIRYFSCASVKASDMGFNYVFPTNGQDRKRGFCPVLSKAFKLTRPYFLHEYSSICSWENALKNDTDLEFID